MLIFQKNFVKSAELIDVIKIMETEDLILNELMENEAFCCGVSVGVNLYQQKVVSAAKEKTHLKIGDDLYYVQNGRERLKEMIEEICK